LNELPPVAGPGPAARIIARADHAISRSSISPNALRVLYRLKEAGYQAFLVGGCVRDVMIGRHPKDYDVATDALPEEVRKLFRNCRLVGRRFRLAHVVFGREVIEVATFRAASAPSPSEEPVAELDPEDLEVPDLDDERVPGLEARPEAEAPEIEDTEAEPAEPAESAAPGARHDRVLDAHGRLLRDNVYGSIDEDVWRRDFTANALYYNIADFSLWDYVGGAEDIAARQLRLIGDPETRYREDPVRMLRAARFEAKLGFTLEPASAAPIERLRALLAQVPAARLFDETLKLFLTGHGARSLEVLRRRQLLGVLFPAVEQYLTTHAGGLVEQLLVQGLRNTDARVAADKPVTPTFLFALLLYGPIALAIESLPPQRWHEIGAIVEACDRALREASARVTMPRRVALGVREMYAMQPRLEQPRGKRALRLLEQPRFRSGFDLLLLRAELGLAPREIAAWWTALQDLRPEDRAPMLDRLPRTRPMPAAESTAGRVPDDADGGEATTAAETGEAPRRRSRRRRRRFRGTA
jgi:poly(A) polymerase